MRMWMVNPRKMCRQHLLGEHLELHMFVGCLNSNKSIDGYVRNDLIEVHNIKNRHSALVKEILRRGYKHNSPLPHFRYRRLGKVNRRENERILAKRCVNCNFRA